MNNNLERVGNALLLGGCILLTLWLLLHGTALQAGVMFAVTALLYFWQGGVFSRISSEAPTFSSGITALTLHSGTLTLTHATGESEGLPLEGLRAVRIVTNDSGPFGNDLYFVLEGDWGVRAIPGDLDDCKQLFDLFDRLPDFDHQQSLQAMGSTSNAVFDVWHVPERGTIT
ncbi:hypothetical protein ACFP81_13800 [Deinococcus lacus]|uniref:Uncharacterized protein n=1 Tax=Deinococcus lacus TaxID=392561 RepID=A0ABW1YG30_9DEIO